MSKPNTFLIDGVVHQMGNEDCPSCEGGMVLGPCRVARCNGLVHQQVIDAYNDMFVERCDVCGKR